MGQECEGDKLAQEFKETHHGTRPSDRSATLTKGRLIRRDPSVLPS
jgi:hypothetical protein